MNRPEELRVNKAVDSIQEQLTIFACGLQYEDFPPEVIHAAKGRVVDTLGALIAGFFGEPCQIVRTLAAQMPGTGEATILGTRTKTTVDMAAFVNATTARYPELNDVYQWPGHAHGHPSDTLAGVFTAAEYAQSSGRDFITGVVLVYEVYQRICDNFHNLAAFDNTNFSCLGIAMAASKLLGLTPPQLSHAISMAIVPNIVLRQARAGKKSMYKAVAAGQAARAGIFAALLARAGMEGPHLPFEGKAGWCDHVARERFTLTTMGGKGTSFKILDAVMKNRPAWAVGICLILAAEKVAPIKNPEDVKQIILEVYERVKETTGTYAHVWNPESREDADHSAPYLVAATLMDGTVTLRSFDRAHLSNSGLRVLMQKIEVVENAAFTQAYKRLPQENRARVTVVMNNGERLVGEAGGDQDDLAAPKSAAQIEEKFRGLTEDVLGAKQVTAILDRLWHLEDIKNVAGIPPVFVFA